MKWNSIEIKERTRSKNYEGWLNPQKRDQRLNKNERTIKKSGRVIKSQKNDTKGQNNTTKYQKKMRLRTKINQKKYFNNK